jgi:hypothetical protein
MELMRYFWDAAMALKPAARERDEGRRFPICQPEPLRSLFGAADLHEIDVRAIVRKGQGRSNTLAQRSTILFT